MQLTGLTTHIKEPNTDPGIHRATTQADTIGHPEANTQPALQSQSNLGTGAHLPHALENMLAVHTT